MDTGDVRNLSPTRPPVNSDKPLPPPPLNRTTSESPVLVSSAPPVDRLAVPKRPSISQGTSFQRPKKRLIWRGKACVVALPLEGGKDDNGELKKYLQPHDIEERLAKWRNDGFGTEGFNLDDGSFVGSHQGQSRNIHPDPTQIRQEWEGQREARRFRVSIPDIKAWNDYKKELQEQKLRALGVSFGDEEPSRDSPVLSNPMSRQASSQTSMPPSHPGAPQSANSFRGMDTFPPPFPAQSNPFARPQSVVSPDISQGPPGGFHFPRQSMAFLPGQPFGPGQQYPPQSASPLSAALSQQPMLGSLPSSRVVSPFVDGRRQSIRQAHSPISPLPDPGNDSYFQGQSALLPHLRPNGTPIQPQQPTQTSFGGLRPYPERKQSGVLEPARFISQPDIASPLPQGHHHRHNVSESLQREIDEAQKEADEVELKEKEQYHLEESFRRQYEEEDTKSQQAAEQAAEPAPKGEVEKPQEQQLENVPEHDELEEKADNKGTTSDIETNPSLAGSPKLRSTSMDKAPSFTGTTNHSAKSSVSRFNAKAPEFVFDPTKSFTPGGVFNFGSNSMERQTSVAALPPPGIHSKTTSNKSSFSSNLNVAAPAFTPGMSQQAFNVPKRDFSFSSKMPTFNVGAPAFDPGSGLGITGNDMNSMHDKPASPPAPKIFSQVNLSDMAKPVKKSKAIPIIKPESGSELEDDQDVEDEMGRISQSNARMKRARRTGGSGDEIPLFATPSREISMEPPGSQSSTIHRRVESISLKDDHQASSPVTATTQLKDFLDDFKSSKESGASSSYEDYAPRLASDSLLKETEVPTPEKVSEAEAEVDAHEAVVNGGAVPPAKSEEKKSSLSATARPFSFNPGAGTFTPKLSAEFVAPEPAQLAPATKPEEQPIEKPVEKPVDRPVNKSVPTPQSAASKVIKKSSIVTAGMGASRYAPKPASPKPSPSPELEVALEPSPQLEAEAGSEAESEAEPVAEEKSQAEKDLEARILNGVSYVEPSYQELDDVMQQLNGDDSDAGVERNPAEAWQSPSRSNGSAQKRSPERYNRPDSWTVKEHLRVLKPDEVTSSPNRLQQPFQYLDRESYGSSPNESIAAEIVQHNARFSPSYRPSKHPNGTLDSPIHRLGSAENINISDWNDVVDSDDESKFHSRTVFFDSRMDEMVGNVIEKRLMPLEQGLAAINTALTRLTSRSTSRRYRRSISADIEDSDADDEDEHTQERAISPLKDRKFEKLKAHIFESIGAQKFSPNNDELNKITQSLAELKTVLHERPQHEPIAEPKPSEDLAKIQESLAELKLSLGQQEARAVETSPESVDNTELKQLLTEFKASMKERQESGPTGDLKKVVEEAISRHMRGKSAPVISSQETALAEKLQLKIDGLESMLKQAEENAEKELKAKTTFENDLVDTQKQLQDAQAEAANYKESADETEESLRSFLNGQQEAKQRMALLEEELQEAKQRNTMLEEVKASQEKTIGDLTDKSTALEDTLEEYRTSYHDKKEELEEAKAHLKNLDEENQNLDRMLHSMKAELQEGIKAKHDFKRKFELVQEDMAITAQNIAKDQSAWRHKEEEHNANHELYRARLEAEGRTRERLEDELQRLESQEREAMKSRALVEQIRGENNHLVGMVNELRTKNHEVQEHAMGYERELHDTRESNRQEIQRILNSTKADVHAANQQVHILRANLEDVIQRLEGQVETLKGEAKDSKHRFELMLEEASIAKDTALREAAEAREAAMQEHYRFHERTMEEAKSSHDRTLDEINATHARTVEIAVKDHERAMAYAREDHERSLGAAIEDKKMTENYLNGRLTVAEEKAGLAGQKTVHLQERVAHLEERLEITKSAAQAAVEAAKAAKSASPSPTAAFSPATARTQLPEKISPQALRESILVLQEQLQQRETQIEKLEEGLSKVDKDAPSKLKEKDFEINWLRELLGVRLDDLQDIITALSSPMYDRNTVRDAVIRLQANLQMEQQEKERTMAGGQKFPSLSSISQVAASPRSLPMAAAAAWGSWRKGQTSLSSLAEMAAPAGATINSRSASQTPSKASPQSFLSGLLTPPSTNVRQTPQRGFNARPSSSAPRRPLGGYSTPQRQISSSSLDNRRALANLPPPETPPLLRGESYDQDAESGHYSLDRYVNEEDDVSSTIDGTSNGNDDPAKGANQDEPFGPTIELAG